MKKHFDVIVVGAGCAGIACATKLAKKGRSVCLIEKSKVLGGRTSSYKDKLSQETLDNGQHLFLGCYTETIALLNCLGVLDKVVFDQGFQSQMFGPDQKQAVLRTFGLPAPFHLLWGLLRYKAFSYKERLGILRVVWGFKKNSNQQLSWISCEDFLIQCKQSQVVRSRFWDPLILATLNIEPLKAPAHLLKIVMEQGFLASKQDSRSGLALVGLSELFGSPAKKCIDQHGGEVIQGEFVSALLYENQQIKGVVLGSGQTLTASDVVCAVPPHKLKKLIEPLPSMQETLSKIDLLIPSSIVSLNFWTDQKISSEPFVGFWDAPFHWLFSKEKVWGDAQTKHYTLVASSADQMVAASTENLVEMARETIGLMFDKPFTIKRAKKSVMQYATWCPVLGKLDSRVSFETPIKGLYFCGDWTDTDLPCTIESAVLSGHRVAGLIGNGC